jgi:hypothetical protein
VPLIRNRVAAGALAATLAAAPAAVLPATAAAKKQVKAPKDGKYSGHAGTYKTLALYVSGKSVQIVAWQFKCGNTTGSTSLSDIPLKKTKKGYKLKITAHGIVSYADNKPDENGTLKIQGRFNRVAKKISGVLSVKTPRCGPTGDLKWSAQR